MQETMFYAHQFAKNQNVYLNLMRDLARYNSKNYEVTTRDGHVKGLLVNLRITAQDVTNPLTP